MFQTCSNSLLCTDSHYPSQYLSIGASLKHKNTQHLYIFNRENPQNSERQNGPRRGLDFIALILVLHIKISAHYPQVISARLPRLQLSLAAAGRGSAPLVVVGNSVLLDCPNIYNSDDLLSQVNKQPFSVKYWVWLGCTQLLATCNAISIVKQSSDSLQAVFSQKLGIHQSVVRQPSGSHQVVLRQ